MSIFFTLSGFLITALLLMEYEKHGRVDIGKFIRKRARRLFPPLLFMLAAHWLLILYYHRPIGLEWRQDLWALTMMINYKFSVHGNDPLLGADIKILWSLAIGGQFYLFWPFMFIGLQRYARSFKRIAMWLIGLILLSTAIRSYEYHIWGEWSAVYYRTEGRLDAFFIGALVAYMWYHGHLPMRRIKQMAWVAWAIFIPSLWIVRLSDGYMYSWGSLLFNLCSAVMVAACLDSGFVITKVLAARPLRLTGRVSYSFYIIHIQVFFWVVLERGYLSPLQRVGLAWGVTLVVGTICYWVAERPFLRRPSLDVSTPTPLQVASD
jgi:peptidoglycan/LPS O-acetylase OafA/YrhL